ncbi:MAG: hypothetical protein ACXWCU_07965 [Caldimonas sp.]
MPIVTIRGTHEHASTGQRYPWRASYVVGAEGAHASIAVAIEGLRQPLRLQTRLQFDPLNTHAARAVNACVNQLIDETDFGTLAPVGPAEAADS